MQKKCRRGLGASLSELAEELLEELVIPRALMPADVKVLRVTGVVHGVRVGFPGTWD